MGTGKIGKVHDSFFKKVFNDEQNIRDFFKISLPAEIYSEINLDDLDIDNTNYIDDSLKEHLSDIVIKTKLKSDKEQDEINSDIYILFEHKSYNDKKVLFQVLKYMYMMWENDIRNNRPLRVILPFVFYNGKQEWTVKKNFSEQFKVKESLKKYLLNYEYIFYDTKKFDFKKEQDKIIGNNVFLMSALMLMKSAFNKDIESVLNIFDFWKEKGLINKIDDIKIFLTYIITTKEVKREKLLEIFKEKNIGGEDIMPTLAREWIEEGKQIGLMEGIEKGKLERDKMLVKNMINQGLKVEDISKFTGLTKKKIEKIINEN